MQLFCAIVEMYQVHGTVVQIVMEKLMIESVLLFKNQKTATCSKNVSSKTDMKCINLVHSVWGSVCWITIL